LTFLLVYTMKKVIRIGDTAVGHTDIEQNAVTGTVTSGSSKTFSGGIGVARNGDYVHFPSHPHQIIEGSPADYQEHTVPITASGKHEAGGSKIALEGDTVPVADKAGPNATLVASSDKVLSG